MSVRVTEAIYPFIVLELLRIPCQMVGLANILFVIASFTTSGLYAERLMVRNLK